MKVIYSIINLKNGKQYIGSTSNFSRRKINHLSLLRNNKHHSLSLQFSWNKNSEKDYKFIILEELTKEENMYEKEQYYLDLYKTYSKNKGYNMTKNSIAPFGNNLKTVYQFTLDGILIKEWPCCTYAADYYKIDSSGLSKCAKEKYRYYGGFIWSYKNTLDNKRIILANSPPKRTLESRKKMSIAAKNRTDNIKPILQYDLNENLLKEWSSTTELVKEKGYSSGYISDCLHNKHKKAYGYIWKFK